MKPEQAAVRDPFVSATTKVAGPALVLDKVVAELGLDRTLRKAFPDTWKEILAMAYFLTRPRGTAKVTAKAGAEVICSPLKEVSKARESARFFPDWISIARIPSSDQPGIALWSDE